MPPILRLSIVYWAGWFHLLGPITHSVIYSHRTKERVEEVRELYTRAAPALLGADRKLA